LRGAVAGLHPSHPKGVDRPAGTADPDGLTEEAASEVRPPKHRSRASVINLQNGSSTKPVRDDTLGASKR
jgi:hypothetical protein